MKKNPLSLKLMHSVFNTWRVMDLQQLLIRVQWGFIAMLFILALIFGMGWKNANAVQRVYLPPSLSGGTVRVNQPHASTLYAFAFQIFAGVNTWSDSGVKDYAKNIAAYQHYLSPRLIQYFHEDLAYRKKVGALDRKRIVSTAPGTGFSPTDVKSLGNGLWKVNLELDVEETVDNTVVKHVVMDYPLLVRFTHVPIAVNPWGLKLAGFSQAPYRLKVYV